MTDERIAYSHTQQASIPKHLALVPPLLLVLILAIAVGVAAAGTSWVIAGTALLGAVLALGPTWALSRIAVRSFSTLHIEIAGGVLTWKFPGMALLSIQLADITDVRVVTPSWMAGVGVRAIRGGTLYNVAVGGAVEVTAHGRCTQLGTDEPEALAAALRSAARVPGREATSGA